MYQGKIVALRSQRGRVCISYRWYFKPFIHDLDLARIYRGKTIFILILLWIKNFNDPQMVQCIIKAQTEFYGWWMLFSCPMNLLLLQVEGLWCCIIFCNQSEYPGVFRWKSSELERTLDIMCLDWVREDFIQKLVPAQ